MEKILVSACLLGDKTRFDGKDSYCATLEKLKKKYELVPFCPEVEGGLSIPRDPAEIANNEVVTQKGVNLTKTYDEAAEKAFRICSFLGIKMAILKDGSPACGPRHIHSGKFDGVKIEGLGVTARYLISKGIKVYAETDELSFLVDEKPVVANPHAPKREKDKYIAHQVKKEDEGGAPKRSYGHSSYGRSSYSHSSYGRSSYGKPRYNGEKSENGESSSFERKPYGERKSYGDRKPYGQHKSYGDRKPYGEGKSYGEGGSSYGDRKPYGERKSYGDRKPYGEHKSYGGRKSYGEGGSSYGEKKTYGDRKPYGEHKSYGDKKPYGERKSYGEHKSYGDRKPYGEHKSYGDKKPYGEGKSYGEHKSYGAKKSYGSHSTYKKPYVKKSDSADPTKKSGE